MLEERIQFSVTNQENQENKEVTYLKVEVIKQNAGQPKKHFSKASLEEMCDEIKKNGLEQPLNVRKTSQDSYEIVKGEKRLRAALMAGLSEVPAVVVKTTDEDQAVDELIQKIQREELSYIEEAEAYNNLISEYNFTQEELALKLGRSQSTIANKIRLLKLSTTVQKILRDNNLTERHARALLKITDEQLQIKVVKYACEKGYNVKKTEELVQRAIDKFMNPEKKKQMAKAINGSQDIKVFVCNVKNSVNELKAAGVNVRAAQIDRGDYVEFIIRVPKNNVKA